MIGLIVELPHPEFWYKRISRLDSFLIELARLFVADDMLVQPIGPVGQIVKILPTYPVLS
jgi:hypothetical protein